MSPDGLSDDSDTLTSTNFFFPDGTLVISIQERLYKVHRHFFETYSAVFKTMFSLPTAAGELPEGGSEQNPIILEGVKPEEFECFLSVIYPSDFSKSDNKTVEDWTAVLSLASRWEFVSMRQLAINRLTRIASPVERITRAVKYDVKDWLLPAYTELCARDEPLNLEEGLKLGIRDVIFIGQLRSSVRREGGFKYKYEQIIAEELEAHSPTPESP